MIRKTNMFFSAIAFVFLSLIANCQGVTTPRTPSPASEVSQTIGISKVTVNYSRPSVKGREIWGSLVPYGWNKQGFGLGNSAPWRAGANENTTISLTHNAMVQGQPVPAGIYGLSFVINKDNSGEVILSKDSQSWGSFFYDSAKDEMRAAIQTRTIPQTELLTYDFIDLTKTSAELVLNWEKKQFPVKIEFNVDSIVIANAKQELQGQTGFTWVGFFTAANYAFLNNTHLDDGLAWSNQAVAQYKSFTTLSAKAGILTEMGKTGEADKTMNDALAIATNAEINAYGYQLLGAGRTDKAIEVLTVNTKKFPNDPNTFDSLGEAYFTKGDKKNAIINFKKSLGMNPSAATKANSEKFLQQMGAM